MLSARILARGNYYQPLAEADDLPSLTAALGETCRRRYRRIDRFVQLALVGSGRCAAERIPDPDCGVYIGAGVGPLPSNIKVQHTLIVQHELPAPFSFVNTLGSSAGFYVTDNLNLRAGALFISRTGGSLVAALTAAILDLDAGVTDQALVGVVEVMTLPLADQRLRLGIPPDRQLAEGSHWWLLERVATRDERPRLDLHLQLDREALQQSLAERIHGAPSLCLARTLDTHAATAVHAHFPEAQTTDTLPYHHSVEAAWLAAERGECLLVTGSTSAGLNLLHRLP